MRWIRIIAALLAAGILLGAALPGSITAAEDEEPAPSADDQPAAESDEQVAGEEEEQLPEIRRLPPRTDEEERQYKLVKAQNDPFLLDQLNGETRKSPGEFYDPLDSVLPVTVSDLSRYIVQDDSGVVLGHIEIAVELEPGSGLFQLNIMNELAPPTEITVIARARNLDALSTERSLLRMGRGTQPVQPQEPGAPDVSPLQQPPRSTAEYSYDRIIIKNDQGGVVNHARLRELPFSFDRDLLLLLIRQVDFQNISWPFEAVATDTARLKSLPMALDKPQRVTVLSAEPHSYYCFQSELRVGSDISTWWVEQVPPHRLVKFSMEGLTYTLERYVQQ